MSREEVVSAPLPEDAAPDAECKRCNHYPAYHDGQDGRPCRAWNDQTTDGKCACAGWVPKPTTPPSILSQTAEPSYQRPDIEGE